MKKWLAEIIGQPFFVSTHYQFSYSPWGVRTHIGDETNFYQPGIKLYSPYYCPLYRTYTGHEDLWMFGLLNAKVAVK